MMLQYKRKRINWYVSCIKECGRCVLGEARITFIKVN